MAWIFRHGGSLVLRWAIRLALLGLLIWAVQLPYDREVEGRCRLEADIQRGIRAQIRDEIVAVHVSFGQSVTTGDPIATLSGRDVTAAVAQRKSELREVQAQLALLQVGAREEDIRIAREKVEIAQSRSQYQDSEYKRQEVLLKQNLAKQSEVEELRTKAETALMALRSAEQELARTLNASRPEEIEAARARVDNAKARLEEWEKKVPLLELTSPIAGHVVTPNLDARIGQVAEVGDLIAVVVDTGHLVAEIAADESAAVLVEPGMPADVRLFGLDGELVRATVSSVSHTASSADEFPLQAVRTDTEMQYERSLESRSDQTFHYRVRADLDEEDIREYRLRPGMTGYARITVGQDVFWRAALRPFKRYFLTEVWSWLP